LRKETWVVNALGKILLVGLIKKIEDLLPVWVFLWKKESNQKLSSIMEGFDFAIKSEIEGYNVNLVKTVLAKKLQKNVKRRLGKKENLSTTQK
jgi:hypothetical protein